jgi:cobalt-zinc-cadmium efflux system protein
MDGALKGRLRLSVALTGAVFVMEVAGGYLTGSIALISDAVHVFMDVFALGLSWFAIYISGLPPTETRTYGLHRAEVFVSFINSFVLLVMTGFIFYGAYLRLLDPRPVESVGMMVVAAAGLAANLTVALWLRRYAASDLNIKSAFLHVVGDAAASVGVMAGAAVIYFTGWHRADPLISILIGGIVLWGAARIMTEASHILLEGVPREVELKDVVRDITALDGVKGVHRLHIWSICHNVHALSAHIDMEPAQRGRTGEIFEEVNRVLSEKHHIFYTTLQPECTACANGGILAQIAHKERGHAH